MGGAGPTQPRHDDIHIWQFDLDAPISAVVRARDALSSDEVASARRFARETDRRRYEIGRAALRHLLGEYTGVAANELRFRYGDRGKPSLEGGAFAADVRFNVAHSDGVFMCAVTSGRDVGIDVERVHDGLDLDAMMALAFTADEQNDVRRSVAPPVEFTRIWVRKEAVAKATGEGMGAGLFSLDSSDRSWSIIELIAPVGYMAAVAVGGDAEVSYLTRD